MKQTLYSRSCNSRIRLRFWRDKFQQISNFTVQNRTQPCQHIHVQTSDRVVAIVIDLRPLHLRTLAEFVFADAVFFNDLCQIDFYCTKVLHKNPHSKKI